MKREIKTGNRSYPSIRIRIAERSAKDGVELSIELLPEQNTGRHRQKRKKNPVVSQQKPAFKKFAARPVVGYMNIAQKIAQGRRVYVHMLKNTDFPRPVPGLSVLKSATEALDDAYIDALHGADEEKEKLGREEWAFDQIYTEIVEYVDGIANGSEEIYRSAGMEPMVVYGK